MNFLTDPLLKLLLFMYTQIGDLGWAIIIFTTLLRLVMAPLSVPAIKSQKKMQQLKPEIDKLKKLHGEDKIKLQQAQIELYKKHNINPASGCLPYILQFVVLIALYQVLTTFLQTKEINGTMVQTMFMWFDLSKPDHTYILPILSGITQLILSLMILPGAESHNLIPDNAKSKKLKEANKKEDNALEMAEQMQKQMVFMMPVVTGIAALQFPSGLAMYWVLSTVFSIIQQWVVSGPGGLLQYSRQALSALTRRISPQVKTK